MSAQTDPIYPEAAKEGGRGREGEEDTPMTDVSDPEQSATQGDLAPPIIAITGPAAEPIPEAEGQADLKPAPITSGASSSTPAAEIAEATGSSEQADGSAAVRVFNPAETPSAVSTPSELDESFFESTLSDVQAHHASVLARSKRLNEAPLLTSKHREEEKEGREKRKAERWPSTTIRIKFSDGTQVQSSFPSSSPIQPVYAFVRTCLDPSASSKPFTLWQPPKFTYPEHPLPSAPGQPTKKRPLPSSSIVVPVNYGPVRGAPMAGLMGGTGGQETLADLGLVPQSVLMIRWADDETNATGYPAPLLPELRQKAEPLPTATASLAEKKQAGGAEGGAGDQSKEKKIPKWLQKGLLKKKK